MTGQLLRDHERGRLWRDHGASWPKSPEAERTTVAKAARDTYIVDAMVALIGKSALTPRSPFAVLS